MLSCPRTLYPVMDCTDKMHLLFLLANKSMNKYVEVDDFPHTLLVVLLKIKVRN